MTEKASVTRMNTPPEGLLPPGLFALGRCMATMGAVEVLSADGSGNWERNGARLLDRHAEGDWGDLDADDCQVNKDALAVGARILSCYETPGGRLYVITEADRAMTTILCPEEY